MVQGIDQQQNYCFVCCVADVRRSAKMNTRNHEHYTDRTAYDAIKAADKPPNAVRETVENMRREANKRGFEVFGRIKLRDKKTGKIYR